MSNGVRSTGSGGTKQRQQRRGDAKTAPAAPLRPPVYPEHPHTMTFHGDTRVDPFYYLRNKKDDGGTMVHKDQVKTWLKQENAYASEQLNLLSERAHLFVLQHAAEQCSAAQQLPPNIDPAMFHQLPTTVYKEMKSRWKETDMSLPTKDRSYWYFSRTYKGKEHPVYCRLRYNDQTQDLLHRFAGMLLDDPDAELPALDGEEILVDVNALEEELGLAYIEVGDFDVSPDETKLLISVDMSKGKEIFTILMIDLAAAKAVQKEPSAATTADPRRPAAATPTTRGKARPLSSSSSSSGKARASSSVGAPTTAKNAAAQHAILRTVDMFPSSGEVLWHTDDAFFYFALDDTHRPFRLIYHSLAHPPDSEDADVILFEELDQTFSCSSLCFTDDETWIQFCTSSKQQEEWHVMPVGRNVPETIGLHGSDSVFQVFHPRADALEYDISHVAELGAPPPAADDVNAAAALSTSGVWLVRSNRGGACRNFTLDFCVSHVDDGMIDGGPRREPCCSSIDAWRPLLRYDDTVTLEHVSCTKHFICLGTRRGGCPMAFVMPMAAVRDAIQRGRLPIALEDTRVVVRAADLLMCHDLSNDSAATGGSNSGDVDCFVTDLASRSDDWAQVLSVDVSPCTDDYDCSELRLYAHHPIFPARVYHTQMYRAPLSPDALPTCSSTCQSAADCFAPPTLLRVEHVRGQPQYDANAYCVRRVWVPASSSSSPSAPPPTTSSAASLGELPDIDATVRIPMTIVYRASTFASGRNPCLVTAYGSYGDCNDPEFTVERLSLLDRGVVYAVANVRGGGELGRSWRDAGRLSERMNSFVDFVDCSKYLIDQGFSHPKRLCSLGGSAGGTVVAAAMLLAPPGLYRAVLPLVPFVDCLTTMLDPSIPLTTAEWEDWGNPIEDADAYHCIKAYSPMDNLHKLLTPSSRSKEALPLQVGGGDDTSGVEVDDYPQLHIPRFIFVESGYGDPRVPHWEPMAFVARLRAMVDDQHRHQSQQQQQQPHPTTPPPLILHLCNLQAGHGGASGRYGQLKELANEYAFVLAAVYCDDS